MPTATAPADTTAALGLWHRVVAAANRPVAADSAAVFRVAFGLLVTFSSVRFLARGWVDTLYLEPADHLTYVGFDWESKYFMRVDRDDSDDRLELEQKLVKAGLTLSLTKTLSLDVNGGYAFDRSFAEGADRHERDDHELDVDDTWFGGLTLSVKF